MVSYVINGRRVTVQQRRRNFACNARVYGWFTEGFDTRDLKEAKALLDTLPG